MFLLVFAVGGLWCSLNHTNVVLQFTRKKKKINTTQTHPIRDITQMTNDVPVAQTRIVVTGTLTKRSLFFLEYFLKLITAQLSIRYINIIASNSFP